MPEKERYLGGLVEIKRETSEERFARVLAAQAKELATLNQIVTGLAISKFSGRDRVVGRAIEDYREASRAYTQARVSGRLVIGISVSGVELPLH